MVSRFCFSLQANKTFCSPNKKRTFFHHETNKNAFDCKKNLNVDITKEGRSGQLAGNSEVTCIAENPSSNAAFLYLGIWG